MYIPDRGDIIYINFDPSVSREIMKRRPAYVISRKVLNAHTELAIVAPISSTTHRIKLDVELEGTNMTGVIKVTQLKALDYFERDVEFIENAPDSVVNKVTDIATIIVQ